MTNDNTVKKFLIHRLVAIMFVPNDENKPQVNHITESAKDFNYYKNLEWSTASENQIHHYRYGDNSKRSGNTSNHFKGESRYNANVSEKNVREICCMLESTNSINEIMVVMRSKINLTDKQLYALIYHLKKRNSWKHITKYYCY